MCALVTVVVTCHLLLPQVSSLKEKRRIIKSLIARIRNDFNVSIAEVGENDTYRRAIIGAAAVSNSAGYSDRIVAGVIRRIEGNPEVILGEVHTETY